MPTKGVYRSLANTPTAMISHQPPLDPIFPWCKAGNWVRRGPPDPLSAAQLIVRFTTDIASRMTTTLLQVSRSEERGTVCKHWYNGRYTSRRRSDNLPSRANCTSVEALFATTRSDRWDQEERRARRSVPTCAHTRIVPGADWRRWGSTQWAGPHCGR